MFWNNKWLACILIMTSQLCGEIRQTHNILDLQQYKHDQRVLFIFDLDETLIKIEGNVGGDKWISYLLQHYEERRHDLLKLYDCLQNHVPITLVEESIPAFISDLRLRHVVIAITSRGQRISERTLAVLGDLDVSFSPFDLEALHMRAGVMFTDGGDKGEALDSFLQTISSSRPSMVVMVDDKIKYLHQVERTAQQWGIPFVGFHYTRCALHPFSMEEAHKELLMYDDCTPLACRNSFLKR